MREKGQFLTNDLSKSVLERLWKRERKRLENASWVIEWEGERVGGESKEVV